MRLASLLIASKKGVEVACDLNGRGGYESIVSQGVTAPIEFENLLQRNKQ